MLVIKPGIQIPIRELQFNYVKSSGPGGQNVNKLSTKAVLRWNLYESEALSDTQMRRVEKVLASKLTQDGELVITSDKYRNQGRNTADCMEKLSILLLGALKIQKKRRPTKPSKRAVEKRLDSKKRQSQKKENRKVKFER